MTPRIASSLVRRWRRGRAFVSRISPRARDVAMVLASLGSGAGYAVSLDGEHPLGWVLVVGLVLTFSALSLWWRRRYPVVVTLGALAAAALTGLPVTLAFALVTLAIRRRDRVLAAIVGLSFVADVVRTLATGGQLLGSLAGATLFYVAVVAFGAYVGARRDLIETLRERAERAEAERELRADQARLGERTRIAREMHDVLAHKVSLVALHAGGLEVNPGSGPEQVERTAALIRSTAREALEDLREVLGVLRQDESSRADLAPHAGVAEIEPLIESSRAAGVTVSLVVELDGEPPDLLGRNAFRVVQEALTNVHKHARGATTAVHLTGGPRQGLEVDVRNRPPVSADSLLPGSGLGLVGLAERVGLAGGVLESGPTPDGGWRVLARMPWGADDGEGPS